MRSRDTSGLVGTQRNYRIRKIFLRRRDTYTLRDVNRLTGIRLRELLTAVAAGEVEAAADLSITWPQLAAIAVDRWGIAVIEDELGDDAALLPPLVRTVNITLRLPRYQVAMLDALRASGADIAAVASDLFLNLAEERAEEMEQSIPGFRAAMNYPETTKETP